MYSTTLQRLINFKVIDSDDLILEEVYNYPNPLTENTYFQFEHNMPDQNLTIRIDIFDFSGRLICSIHRQSYAGGYRSEPVEWDGRDMNGNKMPRGIYPYRVAVETDEGHYAEQFQKLMILN
jgi:flagellar hook assembly protein FlgD